MTMPVTFEEACKKNDAEEVSKLLNQCRPVPVEIRNGQNMSGLMLASSYGAVDVCQVLIDNKCDLDSRDVINCITNVI
jgi:hypothetical protein